MIPTGVLQESYRIPTGVLQDMVALHRSHCIEHHAAMA